jgi:hypothetical protein
VQRSAAESYGVRVKGQSQITECLTLSLDSEPIALNPSLPFRIIAAGLCFALAFLVSGTTAAQSGPAPSDRYRIDVKGPLGDFTVDCSDPCEVDERTSRPQPPPEVSIERSEETEGRRGRKSWTLKRDPTLSYAEEGIVCIGRCGSTSPSSKVMFGPLVSLQEGVTLRVRDGRARFVFHSIVEGEAGPMPRSSSSEFRIDRPRIELELYGHRVVVDRLAASELGERTR